jgi:hypothetical protein
MPRVTKVDLFSYIAIVLWDLLGAIKKGLVHRQCVASEKGS